MVIAIIGILVLLSVPSFFGQTDKAKLSQIKNDIKVYEGILAKERLDEYEYFSKYGYELMDKEELAQAIKDGKVYTTGGKFTDNYDFFNEVYHFPQDFGESKLEGDFIYSEDLKKVLYLDKKGISVGKEEVVLATDEDFEFIQYDREISTIHHVEKVSFNGQKGYWSYIGKDKRVQIPDEIKGTKVNNSFKMFSGTYVEEVRLNKDIISVNSMFKDSKAEKNILDEGENSSVIDAERLFENSNAKEINIDNFTAPSVVTLVSMFQNTKDEGEIKLDFKSESIRSIRYIFSDSSFKKIDISGLSYGDSLFSTSAFYLSNAEEITLGSNMRKPRIDNFSSFFDGSKVSKVDLENINLTNAKDIENMFRNTVIEKIDLSHTSANEVTKASGFAHNAKAKEILLPQMNFSKVENAKQMFFKVNLDKLNLFGLNVSNVRDFDSFLYDAKVRELRLFDFKDINKSAKLHQMFAGMKTNSSIDISNLKSEGSDYSFLSDAKLGGLIADNVHIPNSVLPFYNLEVSGDLSLKNMDTKIGDILLKSSTVVRTSSKKPIITVTSQDLYKIAYDKYNRYNSVDIKLLPTN